MSRPIMLDARLFPPYVSSCAVGYDPERDGSSPRPFGIDIPATLVNAVPKRRAAFAAGRWCAHEALRVLAPGSASIEIAIGSQREPVFPPGFVGSISHTDGIAAVAVASASRARGLGLDIEHWMDADTATGVRDHVLVHGESERLQTQTGWSAAQVATLVFSAKEALYKCLFPTVQTYFDFQDAELTVIHPSAGRFEIWLRVPLAGGLRAGDMFDGRFQVADGYVVTTVIREDTGHGAP